MNVCNFYEKQNATLQNRSHEKLLMERKKKILFTFGSGFVAALKAWIPPISITFAEMGRDVMLG